MSAIILQSVFISVQSCTFWLPYKSSLLGVKIRQRFRQLNNGRAQWRQQTGQITAVWHLTARCCLLPWRSPLRRIICCKTRSEVCLLTAWCMASLIPLTNTMSSRDRWNTTSSLTGIYFKMGWNIAVFFLRRYTYSRSFDTARSLYFTYFFVSFSYKRTQVCIYVHICTNVCGSWQLNFSYKYIHIKFI